MPVANNESDDTMWGVRGVPRPLIEKVKAAATNSGMNIGKIVELSLKKFFDEEAADPAVQAKVENRIAEIEAGIDAKIDAKVEAKLETLQRSETVKKRPVKKQMPTPA